MAHWSDYTLRGWLSFLAFVHFGLLARSVLDPQFIQDKIFTPSPDGKTAASDPLTLRVFGAFSLCQGFMLIHAAIHLYVLPVQYIAIFILSVNIYFVISESFYYKTIDFYGHVLLPSSMSIVSLLWLTTFHFVWKPWVKESKEEEYSLKSMYAEGKKKAKSKAAAAASGSTFGTVQPRFFLFNRGNNSADKIPKTDGRGDHLGTGSEAQLRQRKKTAVFAAASAVNAMSSGGLDTTDKR